MREHASRRLQRPVAFELSLSNVDKPPLDYFTVEERLSQLRTYPTWLTRAPTFADKAACFPGATFVVGADTLQRIADPQYYHGRTDLFENAMAGIAAAGCRFLVYGRELSVGFVTVADLVLPRSLRALCDQVLESEFRCDVSSTGIRDS